MLKAKKLFNCIATKGRYKKLGIRNVPVRDVSVRELDFTMIGIFRRPANQTSLKF